ncbi:MAG: glycosyltransferase [Candidatus Saganbacteria bacterium]|nr:glycosyltransferase [Candidatus Saganbacteria bacterium]
MQQKKLSVYIPNYNYGHYLKECLEAVFSQSLSPDEVIVVDDASTDNSITVVESFMQKYPNLRLLKNEKNLGVAYSMNKGVAASSGDYIVGTASDDKILPGFFEQSMHLLMQYPEAGFCCSDAIFLEKDKKFGKKLYLNKDPCYFSPQEVLHLFKNDSLTPFIPHTIIVKRKEFLKAGGFIPELKWFCDSFVFSVIAFRYGFCYVPKALTTIRVHALQYGGGGGKRFQDREVIAKTIDVLMNIKYQDVLPMFQKTAGFSQSPWEVFVTILFHKKYWNFLSLKLLRFAFFDLFKRKIMVILPKQLANFIRGIGNGFRWIKLMFRRNKHAS